MPTECVDLIGDALASAICATSDIRSVASMLLNMQLVCKDMHSAVRTSMVRGLLDGARAVQGVMRGYEGANLSSVLKIPRQTYARFSCSPHAILMIASRERGVLERYMRHRIDHPTLENVVRVRGGRDRVVGRRLMFDALC